MRAHSAGGGDGEQRAPLAPTAMSPGRATAIVEDLESRILGAGRPDGPDGEPAVTDGDDVIDAVDAVASEPPD